MTPKRASERRVIVALGLCAVVLGAAGATRTARAQGAVRIFEATGVRGGLVVHVGCGDGRLTAALSPSASYVVHGLDADGNDVAKARAHVRALGIYGRVSIERWGRSDLPYADDLVNLLVSADLGDVPMPEVMRVLAPRGVAYVLRGGRWTRTVKPPRQGVDEWTHYLHDASGNPVARDRVVGPPRVVQWIAGPRHARSHEHTPSTFALVSSGGRIFYVADEGPTVALRRGAEWSLVARDAHNGILLWKRHIDQWYPLICGWTQNPVQLQRKVVAVGDRVYATLGYHAPLSALDAATGETVRVYDDTRGTEEILCHEGVLLLSARKVTDERVAELKKWEGLSGPKESPLYTRDTMAPLLARFRGAERRAARTILALDAETGRVLWKTSSWSRNNSLCAAGDRVFYHAKELVCLDLKTGRQRWTAQAPPLRVISDTHVVCADNKNLKVLSAEDGKQLWSRPCSLVRIRDVFIVNESLWVGGFQPYEKMVGKKRRGPEWGPYFATQRDLATGDIVSRVEPEGPGHHHRCWRNKATERYILGGRRGVEFIDLETGDYLWNNWVRGVCRYGVMPCNGLLYAPPHACACYIAAKLSGFYALAPGEFPPPAPRSADRVRLTRGAAYADFALGRPTNAASEWPTYRHDAARSGYARTPVPAGARPRWNAEVGGKLSTVTVAGGRLYVACVDEHRLCALDAESGRPAWSFTAGARVDSPPTVHDGRAIFGCHDGYVYSLRASDGELAWRLRAARAERRVLSCGQLESASPAPGSVLIQDGVAFVTAGRSTYLDGGIDLHRVRPGTGEILSTTPFYSPDPATGRQPAQYGPCYMPGALSDILSSDGTYVYLRDTVFDTRGQRQEKGDAHLFTLTGFLDGTWAHRSYWMFGEQCRISSGCSWRGKNLVAARIFVSDGPVVYGYGREIVHWSSQLEDKAYRLFALDREQGKRRWKKRLPIHVRAMVGAGETLFVAGPRADVVDGLTEGDVARRALLLAISTSDGSELARHELDAPPVFDGMAAANGRLYLATESGRVVCMGR